jgi:signal transduction histidine kinase
MAAPGAFFERVQYLYAHPREVDRDELTLKDGKIYERYSAPMIGADDLYFGRVWFFRDITERKRAEHQITQRMKELRAFYGVAEIVEREGITQDELYRECANILAKSWQYPEISCARIVMGDSEFRTKNFMESAWKQSAPVKVYGKLVGRIEVGYLEKRSDEDEGPFLKEERLLINAFAERIGHITERKQVEEDVRRLNEELERRVRDRTAQFEVSNKELETFAYSVSHDLRGPLRAIDGFSLSLLKDAKDTLSKDMMEDLVRVRKAAQRMSRLIDSLLTLSRTTRQEMTIEPVDLSLIAREIASDLQKSDPSRSAEFVITPGMMVNGDKQLLHLALQNLLNNAWKFSRNGKQALIEFGVESTDGKQVYFVRDNGAGFDMTYVDKLFGSFQRLHSEKEFEGTGIGLATVQRIIQRHGGKIWAEGMVGAGATFYFTI